MRLRAITQIKNDHILAALERLGWRQSDAARAANVHPNVVSRLVRLRLAPSRRNESRLHAGQPGVLRVAAVLGLDPEVAAPPELSEKPVQTVFEAVAEVDLAVLAEAQEERMMLPAPDHAMEVHEEVEHAIRDLSARERLALDLRYGLHGEKPHTLREAGKRLGVTQERFRMIVAKAERKARQAADR